MKYMKYRKYLLMFCVFTISVLCLTSCDEILRNSGSNPFENDKSVEDGDRIVYASPIPTEAPSGEEENVGAGSNINVQSENTDSSDGKEDAGEDKGSDKVEGAEAGAEESKENAGEAGSDKSDSTEVGKESAGEAGSEKTDSTEVGKENAGEDDTEKTDSTEVDKENPGEAGSDKSDGNENDKEDAGEDGTDKKDSTEDGKKNAGEDGSDKSDKEDKGSVDKKAENDDKKEPEDTSNRYKSQELRDYISKPVTEMSDEEFAAIAPTVNMSFEELVGDNGIYNGYPEALPYPDTYKIVVDLRYCITMVFTRDEEGNYTVPHRFMICSPGASTSCTPTGVFSMKDYRVRNSIFNNTDSYAQYWTLINGRIYFHSMLYTSRNASDYTESSYNNLGHGVSHGCVRLAVPDARWIWYNIAPGTTVVIRYGAKDDEQMQEIKNRLKLAKLPSKRVKITKGEVPDTDNWSIDEVPQEVPYVNGHQ